MYRQVYTVFAGILCSSTQHPPHVGDVVFEWQRCESTRARCQRVVGASIVGAVDQELEAKGGTVLYM